MTATRTRLFVVLAIPAVVLAGCSSSHSATSSSATTTTQPVATTTTPNTFAPTTTTTAPPATSAPAVSATFVSAGQGYVLEQSGRVDTTSDSGTTWKVAGSLPTRDWQGGRIRFIDAADGFAFHAGYGPLLITHDAGATWTTVSTPFTATFDLAILHGMIYAVGTPQHQTGSFGIWSTPVEHLVWKQDPLAVPIGAGPVPTVQIVLAGTAGWILVNNRVVVGGARLSTSGTWSTWTPPCSGKNGPAYLSASTATDVIASCNEGSFGPPARATTVYASRDGGNAFTRHVAPTFGPIAAATATTAVIAGGAALQRTTDGSATWSQVGSLPGAVVDTGFTTTTQGFAVVEQHGLLMTRDAGASWQTAPLP